jgi:hypothetical protein
MGGRAAKDVQVRVNGPEAQGKPRALVIARHKEDGNTGTGYLDKRLHGQLDQTVRHAGPKKEIASMDDQIDLATQGRLESTSQVGEEIPAPPRAVYARVQR